MATIKEIRKDKGKEEKKHEEAKEELRKFKGGENDGKWLEELRRRARRNDISEWEEKQLVRLEKNEEELKKKEKDWGEQVRKFQDVLLEFKGEGNERIA